MSRILLIFSLLCLMSGCGFHSDQRRFSPIDFEKEINTMLPPKPPIKEEGSLWSDRESAILYADVKARNVGDIVTINIVEKSTASKNAETKTERDSGSEANWSGLFELITKGWKIHNTPIGTDQKINIKNSFDGKGETSRTSYMSAYITARVIHVLPNGNLVIRGSRQVRLNNEDQFIFVQGIVRPEDISSNNTVLSTYIAEAVIELGGSGIISDKQRPGWLMRIVDWLWPF
jgi:flagellar L-ring protein precursor FlgH